MTTMTREQYRAYARQWEETGRELERIRWEALRDRPYDEAEVNAVLEMGDPWQGSRTSSGLVRMQEELACAYGSRGRRS